MTIALRTTLLLVAVALLTSVTATAGLAHSTVTRSVPGPGQTLTQPLEQVTLSFDEQVDTSTFRAALEGPNGDLELAEYEFAGNTVTVPLSEPAVAEGEYAFQYGLISTGDGEQVTNTLRFTLAEGITFEAAPAAAGPSPSPTSSPEAASDPTVPAAAPSPATPDELPLWLKLLSWSPAAVLVLAGLTVAFRPPSG